LDKLSFLARPHPIAFVKRRRQQNLIGMPLQFTLSALIFDHTSVVISFNRIQAETRITQLIKDDAWLKDIDDANNVASFNNR